MIILLMGVSGVGKTTVGQALAKDLGWRFADADDYHPAANIAKMHAGIALTDEDRAPWLEALHQAIRGVAGSGRECRAGLLGAEGRLSPAAAGEP